jgi:serine/threonine protein kinase
MDCDKMMKTSSTDAINRADEAMPTAAQTHGGTTVSRESEEDDDSIEFCRDAPSFQRPSRFDAEVTQIAKMRANAMQQSDSYKRLMKQVSSKTVTSNVAMLRGSQIELGKCIMFGGKGGGFNAIYKIKSISPGTTTPDQNSQMNMTSRNDVDETEATDVTEGFQDSFSSLASYDDCVVRVLRNDMEDDKCILALSAAEIVKEGLLLASLDSPYILKARAYPATGSAAGFSSSVASSRNKSSPQQQDQPHDAFFLIMENLNDTLADRLCGEWKARARILKFATLANRQSKQQDFLAERLLVALQLADAMAYIHRLNILHRDLKPSNVGFAADGTVKLFDFDHARLLPSASTTEKKEKKSNSSDHQKTKTSKKKTSGSNNSNTNEHQSVLFNLTGMVGTQRYMSPECGKGEPYNLQSDVYTFGLILYWILSLREPYRQIPPALHKTHVFRDGLRPTVPSSWPESIKQLVQGAWSANITSRPTMQEIHSVLYSALNQMQGAAAARNKAKT